MAKVKLESPGIPFISGVTGTWISDEEVRDPRYWVEQMRKPVRFSDGIAEIVKDPARILLEVGPGNSLCVLAKEHVKEKDDVIFASLRHVKQTDSDFAFLVKALARLWLAGVTVDWKNYYKNETRYRIPLPTYPFERKRYWLEEMKDGRDRVIEEVPTAVPGEEAGETIPVKKESEEKKQFQPRPELNNEYVTPKSETEQLVAAMWEDLLGIKPVGLEDNFFDLGGHSLLATLFLSRVQDEFQVRLELRSIFEEPTAAVIARMIDEERSKVPDVRKIEDILQEVEGLSEEEIQNALADEKPPE